MNDDIFDVMFMLLITLFGFFCGVAVSALVLTFMGMGELFSLIFFGINMVIMGSVILIIGIVRFLYLFKVVRRE